MANRTIIPIVFTLTISACGGGSSFDTTPLEAGGFAKEGQGFGGDYDFTIVNATRLISTDAELSQDPQRIRIVGTSGVGPITVTLDGETYTLQRAPNNDGPAIFDDGDDYVSLAGRFGSTEFVQLTSLFAIIDGNLNSGLFALGFDTDPAVIAKMSGTAEYEGAIDASIRNGFDDAFGSGNLTMSVNFDGNTISGTGVLTDDLASNADFIFDPVTIRFDETEIDENGFAGTVSVESPLTGTLEDAKYDGRFFGPNGESVAGQFIGRIDVDGVDTDTFIDGGFIATD